MAVSRAGDGRSCSAIAALVASLGNWVALAGCGYEERIGFRRCVFRFCILFSMLRSSLSDRTGILYSALIALTWHHDDSLQRCLPRAGALRVTQLRVFLSRVVFRLTHLRWQDVSRTSSPRTCRSAVSHISCFRHIVELGNVTYGTVRVQYMYS